MKFWNNCHLVLRINQSIEVQGCPLKMTATGTQNHCCSGSNQAAFKWVFILLVLSNEISLYYHKVDIYVSAIIDPCGSQMSLCLPDHNSFLTPSPKQKPAEAKFLINKSSIISFLMEGEKNHTVVLIFQKICECDNHHSTWSTTKSVNKRPQQKMTSSHQALGEQDESLLQRKDLLMGWKGLHWRKTPWVKKVRQSIRPSTVA